MPENATNPEAQQVEDQPGPVEFEPITSQDQLDKIIGDRLARQRSKFADYDELKAKAAKFDEAEEASKSELEKALARAEKAEQLAREAEMRDLRMQVAAEKGLSVAQAQWLQGQDKQELLTNADQLLTAFKVEEPKGAPAIPMAGRGPNPPVNLDRREIVKQLFG